MLTWFRFFSLSALTFGFASLTWATPDQDLLRHVRVTHDDLRCRAVLPLDQQNLERFERIRERLIIADETFGSRHATNPNQQMSLLLQPLLKTNVLAQVIVDYLLARNVIGSSRAEQWVQNFIYLKSQEREDIVNDLTARAILAINMRSITRNAHLDRIDESSAPSDEQLFFDWWKYSEYYGHASLKHFITEALSQPSGQLSRTIIANANGQIFKWALLKLREVGSILPKIEVPQSYDDLLPAKKRSESYVVDSFLEEYARHPNFLSLVSFFVLLERPHLNIYHIESIKKALKVQPLEASHILKVLESRAQDLQKLAEAGAHVAALSSEFTSLAEATTQLSKRKSEIEQKHSDIQKKLTSVDHRIAAKGTRDFKPTPDVPSAEFIDVLNRTEKFVDLATYDDLVKAMTTLFEQYSKRLSPEQFCKLVDKSLRQVNKLNVWDQWRVQIYELIYRISNQVDGLTEDDVASIKGLITAQTSRFANSSAQLKVFELLGRGDWIATTESLIQERGHLLKEVEELGAELKSINAQLEQQEGPNFAEQRALIEEQLKTAQALRDQIFDETAEKQLP